MPEFLSIGELNMIIILRLSSYGQHDSQIPKKRFSFWDFEGQHFLSDRT
jgi:hypothetical protein